MDGMTSAKLPLSGITCNVWLWEPIWIPELYCALYVFVMGVHDESEAKEAKAPKAAAIFSRKKNEGLLLAVLSAAGVKTTRHAASVT